MFNDKLKNEQSKIKFCSGYILICETAKFYRDSSDKPPFFNEFPLGPFNLIFGHDIYIYSNIHDDSIVDTHTGANFS